MIVIWLSDCEVLACPLGSPMGWSGAAVVEVAGILRSFAFAFASRFMFIVLAHCSWPL